jgi:hypothetical protein
MSEWLNNKRLRIDHLIHVSDEAAPPPAPLCIDYLVDSACDRLDLCRDRGVEIGPETSFFLDDLPPLLWEALSHSERRIQLGSGKKNTMHAWARTAQDLRSEDTLYSVL